MGATLGAAFCALAKVILPLPEFSIPAFAIVGMAAMVGGVTGAAMTAVTMIFEMTRNYDIVMPMIVPVAISIGIRRLLSRENIYTIKLVSRRRGFCGRQRPTLCRKRLLKNIHIPEIIGILAEQTPLALKLAY
jgi:CIC family chloride channel protein